MTSTLPSRTASEKTAAGVFALFTTAYLLLHCWISSATKPLWMDELVSYTLATDPSFPHALSALAHGADGGFPSYYFAAWPVAHLLGTGEFCLRAVSSVFMAAGFGLLGGLLRRVYGLLPAMLAVTWSIGGSTLILYQNSELRFYADLIFSATVAVCGFDQLFRASQGTRWPVKAMAFTALGHALLVLCHPFGLAYSAAISFAALATALLLRPKDFLRAYLVSAVAGNACFLLWVRGFLQQTRIVAGKGLMPPPTVHDLITLYRETVPSYDDHFRVGAWITTHFRPLRQHLPAWTVFGGCIVVGALTIVSIWRSLPSGRPATSGNALPEPGETDAPRDRHLLLLAGILTLVPAGIWTVSHLGKSFCVPRYCIPSVAGCTIIYAGVFARLIRWTRLRGVWTLSAGRFAGGVAVALFVALYVVWPLAAAITTPDGYAPLRARIAREAHGVPVLSYPTAGFWQSSHYAPTNVYWFLLDRDTAYDPRNKNTYAVSEFEFSTVLMRFYPDLHILPGAEFLRRNPELIVDTASGDNFWYESRLRDSPAYTEKHVSGLPPTERWLMRTTQ